MSENNSTIRWANKVDSWRKSGKSMKAWCRENKVVYTTFVGWCNRLKLNQSDHSSLPLLSKTQFIELKEGLKSTSGISLEFEGVMIHLTSEFDASLLKRCLIALRGASC